MANRNPVTHLVMPGLEVGRTTPRKGETVTAFLRRTGWAVYTRGYGWHSRKGLPLTVRVNGKYLWQKDWRRTKIAANDNIIVESAPRGGQGSTGKQIIGLVALVAVAALSAGVAGGALATGGLFAAGSTSAYIAAGAIGIGGKFQRII